MRAVHDDSGGNNLNPCKEGFGETIKPSKRADKAASSAYCVTSASTEEQVEAEKTGNHPFLVRVFAVVSSTVLNNFSTGNYKKRIFFGLFVLLALNMQQSLGSL